MNRDTLLIFLGICAWIYLLFTLNKLAKKELEKIRNEIHKPRTKV